MTKEYIDQVIIYSNNLKKLTQEHFIGKILTPSSISSLRESADLLYAYAKKVKENKMKEWEFLIEPGRPIELKKSDYLDLYVKLYCDIKGDENSLTEHNVVMQVWTSYKKLYFREKLDHPDLEEKILLDGKKRMMMLYHFDRRDKKCIKSEPLYHLHVGGIHKNEGNCWLHQKLDVPRIPSPPFDVVLLIEIIFVDLFPKIFESLRYKKGWRDIIQRSQDLFLKDYHVTCLKDIESQDDTLLSKSVGNSKK